jgi:imidazolonepropionase-like amidohydrolase
MSSLLLTLVAAAQPVALPAEPVIIHGARLEIGDGTALEPGEVAISGHRITYVGPVRPCRGRHCIDAAGKILTPGLIETLSHLGLVEIDMEESSNDAEYDADALLPAYAAADAFNPASVLIPVARAHGITAAVTGPAGGILWGSAAWIDTTGSLSSRPSRHQPVALFGGLGIHAARAAGGSRALVWMRLRQFLADARYYLANRDAVQRGQAHHLLPSPIQLDAMEPVLARRIPLVLRAHRASDILDALDLARDEHLRIVIAGGAESWQVAAELARAAVPVILTPSDQLPWSFEMLGAREDTAALLAAAGVDVVISTASPGHNAGRLRQEAGVAVAHGLPWSKALTAITLAPARVFGRDAEVGSIAAGKRADLVLWSKDPLELDSVAERVFIDGAEQSLENRQKALARRYARSRR